MQQNSASAVEVLKLEITLFLHCIPANAQNQNFNALAFGGRFIKAWSNELQNLRLNLKNLLLRSIAKMGFVYFKKWVSTLMICVKTLLMICIKTMIYLTNLLKIWMTICIVTIGLVLQRHNAEYQPVKEWDSTMNCTPDAIRQSLVVSTFVSTNLFLDKYS